MESEYDQKFEEMKKYIPFLEDMIKRLESSAPSSNPRQAQLDKIRSLRDLLLVKKKRMKMENLLKCEQVLINLHAKVEQRGIHPVTDGGILTGKDKTDLNAVRNKLKSIVNSKLNKQDSTETLPEIARASKTEGVCVPGSKEPALFQRRPNKSTTFLPQHQNSIVSSTVVPETSPQVSKRNYTRVLHSPENDEMRWSSNEGTSDTLLFSRRSPRRRTPSRNKKERKKSKQKGKAGEQKDLNITLNVPEERLSSLNTKDILSRIINCSDNDVDINTLRELRSQILGELTHTGSKDDISDLILRSYNKKSKSIKKTDEMEDGELSDSESEIIKSVYSSIVVLDKDKNTKNLFDKASDSEEPRKIQICLVINKDPVSSKNSTDNTEQDNCTIESYPQNNVEQNKNDVLNSGNTVSTEIYRVEKSRMDDGIDATVNITENVKTEHTISSQPQSCNVLKKENDENDHLESADGSSQTSKSSSVLEQKLIVETKSPTDDMDLDIDKKVKIPLLDLEETAKKEVASEIDILQALKKEIFSSTSTALSPDIETPLLHQPKVTKVVNPVEIGTKKRISIENYKAKSVNHSQSFSKSNSKDESKKQSLKLTEKECERFNFFSKIALHDSSDDDNKSNLSIDDVYDNLAPKSPDHEDFADAGLKPPIIIPSDPVDKVVVAPESDVDMRKLLLVPNPSSCNRLPSTMSSINMDSSMETSKTSKEFYAEVKKDNITPLIDPRIKRDVNTNIDMTDKILLNADNMSRQMGGFGTSNTPQLNLTRIGSNLTQFISTNNSAVVIAPNISPVATAPKLSPVISQNMSLSMPLNIPSCLTQPVTNNILGSVTPILTPNARTYEMTPSRLCMENEDYTKDQHVYAPMFFNFDANESESSVDRKRYVWNKKESVLPVREDGRNSEKRNPPWKEVAKHTKQENRIPAWEDKGKNKESTPVWGDTGVPTWEDSDVRNNFVIRDKRYQGNFNQSYNDRYRYDSRESYNRLECPRTPIHSFGHQECPSTPTASFGRDVPRTPVQSFGRSDYNPRSSSNHYGFNIDPRRTRCSEYNSRDDDRERRSYNDRNINTYSYISNQSIQPRSALDASMKYHREQSVGRFERKELNRRSQYRETSIDNSYDNDFESDNTYSNHWVNNKSEYDYQTQNKSSNDKYQRGYCDYGFEKQNTGHSTTARSSGVSDNSENLISIQSNTGKSFIIDGSIKRTFQRHDTNDEDDSFNARRRRAASVGRSLGSDNSVKKIEVVEKNIPDSDQIKRNNSRRASSVGREIPKIIKNFKDIKEDLKSFKLKSDINLRHNQYSLIEHKSYRKSIEQSHDFYLRKDENESRKATNTQYSPTKNSRDPRIRNDKRHNIKSRYEDCKSELKISKNYGIVYSNDNISKGAILGLGYGVKNYKIPKIKRPSPEKDISEVTEDTKDRGYKSFKDSENSSLIINKVEKKIESSMALTIEAVEIQEPSVYLKNRNRNNSTSVDEIEHVKDSECETNKEEKPINNSNDDPGVEKRVTRSAMKKICNEDSLKESPRKKNLKKTKKVCKSYCTNSDLDENSTVSEKESNKITEQCIEDNLKESHRKDSIRKTKKGSKPYSIDSGLYENSGISEAFSVDSIKKTEEKSDDLPIESKRANVNNELVSKGNIMKLETKVKLNNNNDHDGSKKDNLNTISKSSNRIDNSDKFDDSVDDLEAFQENILNDPVVDNINELIADLDQDLDIDVPNNDSKIEENITLDKLGNDGSEETPFTKFVLKYDAEETVTKGKTESEIVTLVNIQGEYEKSVNVESTKYDHGIKCEDKCSPATRFTTMTNTITLKNPASMTENITKRIGNKVINNDAIVSTTEKSDLAEENIDYNSVPDSTNEVSNEINNTEILPDSTGESETTMNFSNEISTNFISENAQPSKLEVPQEINSLLSLLQDKSKMKELISKLASNSSDNEKIKKTLEKLSEIVSDDEDSIQNVDESNKTLTPLDSKSCTTEETGYQIKSKNILSGAEDKNVTQETEANATTCIYDNPANNLEYKPIQTNKRESDREENKKEKIEDFSSKNLEDIKTKDNVAQMKEKPMIQEQKLPCDYVDTQPNEENINIQDVNGLSHDIDTQQHKGKKNVKKANKSNKKSKAIKTKANVKIGEPKVKKPSRELMKLQEDIKEFMKDDDISNTGIRMCRLAKLVNNDEKDNQRDDIHTSDVEPVVFLKKKITSVDSYDKDLKNTIKEKDEKGHESNANVPFESKVKKQIVSIRPGPKSKTKSKLVKDDVDPYNFEDDLINESNTSESKPESSSESGNESVSSYINDNSGKLMLQAKKKIKRKRGRGGWQVGIIKPKNRKKSKAEQLNILESSDHIKAPDLGCFTDKLYCFGPNISTYSCRLCEYTGSDIVPHYMKQHPHSEIPLSRLCPDTASEAIKQCEEINFQATVKIPSNKYTCRFCFKEITKKKLVLEDFFWHVVSMHTGEYVHQCSECENKAGCSFKKDIPPPPENIKGQLLGYICGKCNFTQVSLENLKSHVINRHNDEQTEVYMINLAVLSKKAINNFIKQVESQNVDVKADEPRKLRSTRSKQSITEFTDDESSTNTTFSESVGNIQSKLTFEGDNLSEMPFIKPIKVEPFQELNNTGESIFDDPTIASDNSTKDTEELVTPQTLIEPTVSNDIVIYPHFKVANKSGLKEYVCCINGVDNHYKTNLLISMKKHVQIKHLEKWDGYCFLCKVIVTPQGTYSFKDCLSHYLDKHIDDLPILENVTVDNETGIDKAPEATKDIDIDNNLTKSYINVRPISQLTSTVHEAYQSGESSSGLPVIESVVSLGMADQPLPSPNYPKPESTVPVVAYKYEEAQADIMSKKHRVVLDAMMNNVSLAHIFKCSGRFCSFTTDSAEEALLHSSAHSRIGGEHALCCVYCDYDASGNAIDLVTHVFKNHECCPYVCGICFYRAAASQLVQTHINRVHPDLNASVLRTSVVTDTADEDACLPRKTAVPFYRCSGDHDAPNACKFRTYTPGKFCEHLQSRHQNVTEFLCFICSEASQTPAELVRHIKTHGLKLYQCTWCVFGADNEAELLEHASAKHPNKQPKAFLRIITNKEGTNDFKVLPLVHLNKSNIDVHDIVPNMIKGVKNPVREAERALELEKLIGATTSMFESVTTQEDSSTPALHTAGGAGPESTTNLTLLKMLAAPTLPPPTLPAPTLPAPTLQPSTLPASTLPPTTLPVPTLPPPTLPPPTLLAPALPPISPPPTTLPPPDISLPTLPPTTLPPPTRIPSVKRSESPKTRPSLVESPNVVLASKENPLFISERKPQTIVNIVCIDSDEDNATENVIDLSEDVSTDTAPGNVLVAVDQLYKCSKCEMTMKTYQGLMRHIRACYGSNPDIVTCAHCPEEISRSKLMGHYMTSHMSSNTEAKSGKSDGNIESLSKAKGNVEIRPKRKRSLGSKDKTTETPEKMKKFSPQDIDKLPINPILDDLVYCSLCEFSTKVKLNMVRHLQLHAQQQPVPETAPVNPVPHLESNEKHFDKMLNLASSSIVNRPPDKNNKSDPPPSGGVAVQRISPGLASRYPKYVPDRQRHTCGAKGCSYISVDESMLKCHWETLHSGTNDFHCVHCPPNQHLNTSKPLIAARILGHLKMHDTNLYACSMCVYYHYMRSMLERHLNEAHQGGEVLIVREENSLAVASSSPAVAAPTMDLKPWHCGICQFKSLLRAEVVEHCAKYHNSKMQYKCAYCAFRTSNLENIPKHQSKSHTGKPEEIFYYYYREGSIPDDADGTPRWAKQKQKVESQIKSEAVDNTCTSMQPAVMPATVQKVDLGLVKQEVEDVSEDSGSSLCQEFGQFCEPNGLRYKCPLCKNVTEDNQEAMQSHLYEELKYRKWGCTICSYKAFHKSGFREHVQTEHIQNVNLEPIQLPTNNRIETWITMLLEHQKSTIDKSREKLAIQKAEIKRVGPSTIIAETQKRVKATVQTPLSKPQPKVAIEAERLFGVYGKPSGDLYCCPKCEVTFKEENDMRTHLESELGKIRWYCSNCSQTFQTYHEAQFHCKSEHVLFSSRPVEATRDASVRSNWVESALKSQTAGINAVRDAASSIEDSSTTENENSLLVVRFEQQVTTPEEEMASRSSIPTGRDDEKIQKPAEPDTPKPDPVKRCPYCSYISTHLKLIDSHILKHYGLNACTCPYCGLDGNRKQIIKHQRICHVHKDTCVVDTKIPQESPEEYLKKKSEESLKSICLVCRKALLPPVARTHRHNGFDPDFGKEGDIVVKCCVCSMLHKEVNGCFNHHKVCHPQEQVDYVFCKLTTEVNCSDCSEKFPNADELSVHVSKRHPHMNTGVPSTSRSTSQVNELKRRLSDSSMPPRKVARKSTTKQSQSFAKKSTTKLPFDTALEGYSYYGLEESKEELDKTVLIPFCNTMMPFTVRKLPEIFGKVVVNVKKL